MSKKTLWIVLTLILISTLFVMSGCKKEAKLGSEDKPIVWSFVPSGEMEQVAAGAQSVADLLHDETDLYFETNVATEYAGVIEALCSDPPEAHMASLATFAYVMAADMGVAEGHRRRGHRHGRQRVGAESGGCPAQAVGQRERPQRIRGQFQRTVQGDVLGIGPSNARE